MVGFSGCISGLLGTDQQVTKTTFKPFKLAVSLRDGASVSRINLIAPDGTAVNRKTVSAGQTTVSFPLVASKAGYSALSPGTYEIVVVNDGETIAQREVQLNAKWKVADVQPKNSRDLVITVQNTGDLPVKVSDLAVTDGVPTPSTPPQKGDSVIPQRVNDPNRTELEQYIGNGKRATFRLYDDPLAFVRSTSNESRPQWQRKAVKCRGLTHKATLVLVVAPTGKRTYTLPITYGGKTYRSLTLTCSKVTVGNASTNTN